MLPRIHHLFTLLARMVKQTQLPSSYKPINYADPNLKLGDGKTPLYIANRYSHTEIVTLLLNAGADPAGISAPLGYITSLDDPFAED